ncbi:MAG: hypothetical protein OXL37_13710, partial [Chloroflexota bacterium]|nr:hypothetical protein [Chloroflexota bacterium]
VAGIRLPRQGFSKVNPSFRRKPESRTYRPNQATYWILVAAGMTAHGSRQPSGTLERPCGAIQGNRIRAVNARHSCESRNPVYEFVNDVSDSFI